MSLFNNPDSILQLQKLLQPPDEDGSSSDSEAESQIRNKRFGPSQIGLQSQPIKKPEKPKAEPQIDITIDEWLDKQEKEDNDVLETRKRPEYTISYKQAIGTEDVFLQMGNKTSASSSCEDMIIYIDLPDETVAVQQMDISVTETEIDLTTPMYRLKLPLVHPINPDRSCAKYNTEKKTLSLICRMKRELDYVNF